MTFRSKDGCITFPKLYDGKQSSGSEDAPPQVYFKDLKYKLPDDTWREAILSARPHRHLFPEAAVVAALIETSGYYTPRINDANYPIAARFLLGRHVKDYRFLLENGLKSGDTGCFLGAPPIHRNYNGKEYAYDTIALGAALLDGYSSELQFVTIQCGPVTKKDVVPEASWLFKLYHNGQYFARIGMNLHREDGEIVGSITNIQGQNKKVIRELKPFCEVWSVYCLAEIVKNISPEITILRGMPAAIHPSATRSDVAPEVNEARQTTMAKLYDPTFECLHFKPIYRNMSSIRWEKKSELRTSADREASEENSLPLSYFELRRSR